MNRTGRKLEGKKSRSGVHCARTKCTSTLLFGRAKPARVGRNGPHGSCPTVLRFQHRPVNRRRKTSVIGNAVVCPLSVVCLYLVVKASQSLWRMASYMRTVEATAAFSDSTWPFMGILILQSARAVSCSDRPFPSFPIRKAQPFL